MSLAFYVAVVIVLVTVTLGWLRGRFAGRCSLERGGRTLFVTAHPDDECMFFAPSILAFTQSTEGGVFLLCLSEGIEL